MTKPTPYASFTPPTSTSPPCHSRPLEIASEIEARIPGFQIDYEIDPLRQAIADSWPDSIDDSPARNEWDWQPEYDLPTMVDDMLTNLRPKLSSPSP